MPYSDEYVRYLEARLADSQQQKKTGRKDVQRLTNTTGNAPVPSHQEIATAQRQAESFARQRNLHSNMTASPNGLPRGRHAGTTGRGVEGEYDDVWPPRPHTSSVRYDAGTYRGLAPGVYRLGEETVRYHGDLPLDTHIPPRAHAAQYQLPPVHQQDTYVDDEEEEPETQRPQAAPRRKRQKITWHPLWWLGLGGIAMLLLWALFTSLGTWWQVQRDDWAYQRPRTFQIDAVVGHNDSQQNPSHFIAINLNRHVIVIEIPGGDTSKMRVYNGPTLFGDGEDLAPITLTFKDVNGDGKPDMLIHIRNGDGTEQILVMMNDNGGFRPRKQGEQIHV
jgi:hypothetical protein